MAIRAGTAYVDVRPDMSNFGSTLSSSMRGPLSSMGSMLVSAAKTASVAMGAAVAGTIAVGVNTAMQMEQVSISLETLLGSGKAAKAMLADLQEFAAATPFEFPELATASQKLLALGFASKDVLPMLEDMGNAAAALGLGSEGIQRMTLILGQVQAKGRLMAEDFMQLQEMGVAGWEDLAKHLGVSVTQAQKLVSEGKVSSEDFMEFWESNTARFDGLMEEQSQSLAGMFSTLKDTVSMALADASKPIVDSLKKAMPVITRVIEGLIKAVGPALVDFVGMLGKVFKALLPVLQPVLNAFLSIVGVLGKALVPVFKGLAPTIAQLAQVFAQIVKQIGGPILKVFGQLLVAVAPLLPVLARLVMAILKPLVPILVQIIKWVAKVIKGFTDWLKRGENMEGLIAVFTKIGEGIGNVIKHIIGFVVDIIRFWQKWWQTAKSAGAKIVDAFIWVKDKITGVWDGVTGFFGDIFGGIVDVFKNAWNSVANFWNSHVGNKSFHIPGTNITFDVPDLPTLAKGGIVTRQTLAVIGEAGPEAVVPLDRAGQFGLGGPQRVVITDSNLGLVMEGVIEAADGHRGALERMNRG